SPQPAAAIIITMQASRFIERLWSPGPADAQESAQTVASEDTLAKPDYLCSSGISVSPGNAGRGGRPVRTSGRRVCASPDGSSSVCRRGRRGCTERLGRVGQIVPVVGDEDIVV